MDRTGNHKLIEKEKHHDNLSLLYAASKIKNTQWHKCKTSGLLEGEDQWRGVRSKEKLKGE
jgi:hypothetical protein